jgi:hypothetical protein
MNAWIRNARWLKTTMIAGALATLGAVGLQAIPSYRFATPIFKLAVAPDNSLLVADAGAGIVELRNGFTSLSIL